MRRRLASLLFLVAAACGAGSGDSQPSTTAGAADEAKVRILPATSAPTTTVVPSRFEFVDYTVSGGIAGVTDHLKVYPDGRATYDDGTRVVNFTMPAETVAQLRAALEAAGVASLPSQVQTVPGADRFTYRLIYGGRAVRFSDGTVPPSLRPALAILDRELATGKGLR